MKLKYKKIILLTTISTMGIGLLTLSISQDSTKAKESLGPNVKQESSTLLAAGEVSNLNELETADITVDPTSAPELTVTPIPSPTLAPLPVYPIEKDGYPEIEAFFKDYYVAKSNRDIEKIKAMSSDPTKVMSLEELQKETEYVEDYRNIKCYVKKSIEEGSYIVYIYNEIKLNGIITPAPGLAMDYLVTDSDGNLKSFSGEMDPELRKYYDERLEDEDVKELRKYTEEKATEAKKSDESLKTFWEYLDSVITGQTNTTAQGDTGE